MPHLYTALRAALANAFSTGRNCCGNKEVYPDRPVPPEANSVTKTLFPDGLVGVIFDCDGVMIDSRDANREYYNRILAYLGMPAMTSEQECYAFMATARQALCRILPPHLHACLEQTANAAVNYARDIVPLLRLQPGFLEFIERLHAGGLRMAIATNRVDRGLQTVLDFFALPPYFDPVVTASNAAPKPSPEGTRMICKAWGVAPCRTLFVGDSEHDKTAALGADVVFAAFNGDGLQGHITVLNFVELAQALAGAL